MIQLWDSVIQRNDRNLHRDDVVCSLHFKEKDIERYYTHVIDGQVVLIERGNPKLRKGAVPSVFSSNTLKGLRVSMVFVFSISYPDPFSITFTIFTD
jgi:hypothetical protein